MLFFLRIHAACLRHFDTMISLQSLLCLCATVLFAAVAARAEEVKGQAAPKEAYPQGTPEEPFLKVLSMTKAAESLDRTAVAWVEKQKCGSCHTGWPYVYSRAVLMKEAPTEALAQVRTFFEGRITGWDEEQKVKNHSPREAVGTMTALAIHDAQTTGKLHPVTREALDRLWKLQRKDGAWSWPKCEWPPFEVDDYYGAVHAAVGVGHAPENYAQSEAAKAGVEKLRAYLKATPAPNLHHRVWLLWAAVRLEGLLSAEKKQSTIQELLALQRSDGGWSMESLGKEWEGHRGETANPDAPSDGYGTGLVIFVLRENGVPASHEALKRGVEWLSTHQRESGRWFTRSLNGVKQHFISDTATSFAVMALKACEKKDEPSEANQR
jgi:squalene-hopene/tetraprenyl-beta-curcumene cyclase